MRSTDEAFALGSALEASFDARDRTQRGAWFTPRELAEQLVGACLERWEGTTATPTVLDPAVGGGAFLLAAHRRLPSAELVGVDCDARTVTVARRALELAGATDVTILHGDGLDPGLVPCADLIVGNPPFLSQLRSTTSRDDARRQRLRDWYGDPAAGYVDDAGLFVLAASRLLRPGGVAVLIVPESVLATRSAAGVREAVAGRCEVDVVWRDRDGTFPGTPSCAVALSRRPGRGGGWDGLLADGLPSVPGQLEGLPSIGTAATATADFRDAYYLVADHVAEASQAPEAPRITPVGLIDPAHLRWGEAAVRFAKRRWARPVAPELPAEFLAQRLGAKVLVATQTKVLEALVDADGDLLPTTPAITLRTDRPWHVGAALTSPFATVTAAHRHAGAARARGALKLSAKQVLALPLPSGNSAAWDAAAEAYRAAHTANGSAPRRDLLLECGRQMASAFGMPDPHGLSWWAGRLPSR